MEYMAIQKYTRGMEVSLEALAAWAMHHMLKILACHIK
jgi:hypothetical protein